MSDVFDHDRKNHIHGIALAGAGPSRKKVAEEISKGLRKVFGEKWSILVYKDCIEEAWLEGFDVDGWKVCGVRVLPVGWSDILAYTPGLNPIAWAMGAFGGPKEVKEFFTREFGWGKVSDIGVSQESVEQKLNGR
jgi:hypothetical protein